MEKIMRSRAMAVCAFLALVAVGVAFPLSARGDPLELVDVLVIEHEGVDNVAGLGGLTFHDSSLWMGYAYSRYSLYANGLPGEIETDMGWVGRVSPADGTVLEEFPIPGSDWPYGPVTGLASDGANLYATLRTSGMFGIAKFVPGQVPETVYPFEGPEPAERTGGLTHDGSLLWQAHYSPGAGHLYAIDPNTRRRMNDLRVEAYPFGLTWDGHYFYVSHHDPAGQTSYLAQYDGSGAKVATLELPPALASTPVGDLAVNGEHLYAHVLGSNTIAHLLLPPPTVTAPPMPPGLVGQSTVVSSALLYDGTHDGQTRSANGFEQLPIVASLRHTMQQSHADVLGKARSYYDAEKVHNTLHCLAYGADHDSPLAAVGHLEVNKTLLVPPSAQLPAGRPIVATGTMSLNGLFQATRYAGGPSGTDAEGLLARVAVEIVRTAPGSDLEIFCGAISLAGLSNEDAAAAGQWLELLVAGDFVGTPVAAAAGECLTVGDDFASMPLEDLEFDFHVPAVVGVPFEVYVSFLGRTEVPTLAEGLGAEVVFGEEPLLTACYEAPMDPDSYGDNFLGEWSWDPGLYVPEPATVVLLAAGAGWAGRRRRRAPR